METGQTWKRKNLQYRGRNFFQQAIGLIVIILLVGVLSAPAQPFPDLLSIAGQNQSDNSGPSKVGVELVPQYVPVGLSQRFALAVVLNVPSGWHLYANPKHGEFGQDTVIIPRPDTVFRFGGIVYPPGRMYTDQYSSNYIYEGTTICYLAMEVTPEAVSSPPFQSVSAAGTAELTLQLDLKGQLCSDTGLCLPWQDQVQVIIKVLCNSSSAPAQLNRPELFTDFDLAAAWRDGETDSAPPRDTAIAPDEWLKPVLLALAAGLIMNLMPCVWPIIPIVVMTLMKQCSQQDNQADRAESIKVGLAFAAGILIVFAGLAVVMSVFKLIWGEHFQSNAFKFVLLMIVYVLSLSMFGLFEIVLPAGVSNMSVTRKGYLGALGMGMLATVLATPCGAPFLGPVVAWSLGKATVVMVAMFLIIGAGMALPYVLLTAFPALLGRIPKSGNWMIRLKQAIGFAMLGFSIYLILLFPPGWWKPLLYFCLLLGFCVWLGMAVVNRATLPLRRALVRGIAIILVIAGSVGLSLAIVPKTSVTADITDGVSEDWLTRLSDYKQRGRTVIVKFTANSCKNCAVLDKVIYKTQRFRDKLKDTNARLIVADWSYGDESIKQMIWKLGGPGQALPFAVVFPGSNPDNPILLRNFYSLEDTLAALDEAARRINPAPPPLSESVL